MSGEELLTAQLSASKIDAGKIAWLISGDPVLIKIVFRELCGKLPKVRFACSKSLVLVSEKNPYLLLPDFDRVLQLLDTGNRILKWNALAMIGNLTCRDRNRVGAVLPVLYGFLTCGEMITANHAIAALGKIGRAFPKEQPAIISALLKVERAEFDTGECRNIAIGKVLDALRLFSGLPGIQEPVIEFAQRQTRNTRNATAKRAASFLKEITACVS